MFRVAFAIDDSGARHELEACLRHLTYDGALIFAAYVGANTIEVFVDAAEPSVARDIAEQLCRPLRIPDYEITAVESLLVEPPRTRAPTDQLAVRPAGLHTAVITQVRVHADDRTVSLQARHRPYEVVDSVEVGESAESITVAVFVRSNEPAQSQFVSFAVAFSWLDIVLEQRVANREIIRDALDIRDPPSRPIEPAPTKRAHDLSPEEVLERLERLVQRSCVGRSASPPGAGVHPFGADADVVR